MQVAHKKNRRGNFPGGSSLRTGALRGALRTEPPFQQHPAAFTLLWTCLDASARRTRSGKPTHALKIGVAERGAGSQPNTVKK